MQILFLSLLDVSSLADRNIYTDLLREFVRQGHHVYMVSPCEKKQGKETYLIYDDVSIEDRERFCQILKVKIGNLQKTNFIEKGISTLRIQGQVRRAIEKYFKNVRFDLVLYATPPITFVGVAAWLKKRDGAMTYLMLKDIFPQNAVDLELFTKYGPLYWYFRRKEKKLYEVSDYIGCMSKGNVSYLLAHNTEIDPARVELCKNSMEIPAKDSMPPTAAEKQEIRRRYGIPEDKVIFLYGGNLGKPQDIPFIMDCLTRCRALSQAFFIICGTGTEYGRLAAYKKEGADNLFLLNGLPYEDYRQLAAICDVGLIFLDWRFTIPNFPSRLLSYMEQGMMVVAATDSATDLGAVITEGGFGYACSSEDEEAFYEIVKKIVQEPSEVSRMGKRAREYLRVHFSAEESCRTILSHFKGRGSR